MPDLPDSDEVDVIICDFALIDFRELPHPYLQHQKAHE